MRTSQLIFAGLMLAPLNALAEPSEPPALPPGVKLVQPLSPQAATEVRSTPKAKPKAKESKEPQAEAPKEVAPKKEAPKEEAPKEEAPKKEAQPAPVKGVRSVTLLAPPEPPPVAKPKVEEPKEGEQAPKEGEQTPKEGEQTPKEGEQTPKEGEQAPKEGEQAPKEETKEVVTELPQPKKLAERPKLAPRPPTFVEGELVRVGQIGILPWDNRFGIVMGVERLGEIYYGAVNMGLNHTFKLSGQPMHLTLGVPLRFEVLDARPDQRFNNLGAFRAQDWDEVSDFAKVIQRLQYGSKEQRLFVDINRYSTHSLGHGTLMKRYDANLNFNTSRVGVQLDAFSDYIGFETMLNDITGPNVMGALVFIKPLSLINRRSYLTRSFSIGLSAATDTRAPIRNILDYEDVDNDGRRAQELMVDQQTFQPEALTTMVANYGVDVEMKLIDTRAFDWKMYGDYSRLESGLPTTMGEEVRADYVTLKTTRAGGYTWGNLIRSNLGLDPVHALRLRLEYRNYDPNYLPSYFDSLYEVQRVQYSPNGDISDLANATKLQRVLGRDPKGDRVHGGYFEASWRVADSFALAFGLEVNSQTPDNHGFVHVEVPQAGNWQFSTSYHRRNANAVSDLFSGEFDANDIWLLQTRYRMASWLHTNLSVMTPFGLGAESVFKNSLQVNLSAEIGFAYEEDKR